MARRNVKAGEIGDGNIGKRSRLKDHEEIGLKIIPVHGSQTTHLRLYDLAGNIEAEMIAYPYLEALG